MLVLVRDLNSCVHSTAVNYKFQNILLFMLLYQRLASTRHLSAVLDVNILRCLFSPIVQHLLKISLLFSCFQRLKTLNLLPHKMLPVAQPLLPPPQPLWENRVIAFHNQKNSLSQPFFHVCIHSVSFYPAYPTFSDNNNIIEEGWQGLGPTWRPCSSSPGRTSPPASTRSLYRVEEDPDQTIQFNGSGSWKNVTTNFLINYQTNKIIRKKYNFFL